MKTGFSMRDLSIQRSFQFFVMREFFTPPSRVERSPFEYYQDKPPKYQKKKNDFPSIHLFLFRRVCIDHTDERVELFPYFGTVKISANKTIFGAETFFLLLDHGKIRFFGCNLLRFTSIFPRHSRDTVFLLHWRYWSKCLHDTNRWTSRYLPNA